LDYICHAEAVSAAIILLPDFSTNTLPTNMFLVGPAQPSLVAVQVDDAHLCKAFA